MRYAQVENGIVVNVIVWDGKVVIQNEGTYIASEFAGIGWSYDGSIFNPPVPITFESDS